MPNKALLVIDMQKDLCLDSRRRDRIEAMLPQLKQAIACFAQAGQPVFYICFALPPDDEQFRRFGDRYCIQGTEGAQLIDALLPLVGPIIHKRKHSAFFETDLNERLRQAGVREVYLAGVQTHICIQTTAADASFRGYRAVAIRQCVLSSDQGKSDLALQWIASYVGEVQDLPQVIEGLSNA